MKTDVRIFISSTFVDMQEERNYINHIVMPKLKRIFAEKGVNVFVVDLRWGITEEQQNSGNLLSLCLKQIDNCRPFFIGILGERYGWIPTVSEFSTLPDQLLVSHEGKSITELEICYGVLDHHHEMNGCFCLRDSQVFSQYLQNTNINEEDAIKLAALKARILKSGLPCINGYRTLEEMGQMIIDSLTQWLQANFPTSEDSEENKQKSFQLKCRELEKICVFNYAENKTDWSVQERFENTDLYYEAYEWFEHFMDYPESILLKATPKADREVCNAILNRYSYNNHSVIVNVDASEKMKYWPNVLKYILIKTIKLFPEQLEKYLAEIPKTSFKADTRQLKNIASRLFANLKTQKRFSVIITDIDLLYDYDDAQSLTWLPKYPNQNIKFICSGHIGNSGTLLENGGWLVRNFPVVWNNVANTRMFLYKLDLSGKDKGLTEQQVRKIRDSQIMLNCEDAGFAADYFVNYVVYQELHQEIECFFTSNTYNPGDVVARIISRQLEKASERTQSLFHICLKLLCELRVNITEDDFYQILKDMTGANKLEWVLVLDRISPLLSWEQGRILLKEGIAKEYILKIYKGSCDIKLIQAICKVLKSYIHPLSDSRHGYESVFYLKQILRYMSEAGMTNEIKELTGNPSNAVLMYAYNYEMLIGMWSHLHAKCALNADQMYAYLFKDVPSE